MGGSLPPLPEGWQRDSVLVILEFLHAQGYASSMQILEEESGVGPYQVFNPEVKHLRELIVSGDWKAVLDFLLPLKTRAQYSKMVFDVKRQEFLEHFEKESGAQGRRKSSSSGGAEWQQDQEAVGRLVAELRAVEGICSKEEFNELRYCLTLPRLQDHPHYRNWTLSRGRLLAFDRIAATLNSIYSPSSPAMAAPLVESHTLETLLREALAYQQEQIAASHRQEGDLSTRGSPNENGDLGPGRLLGKPSGPSLLHPTPRPARDSNSAAFEEKRVCGDRGPLPPRPGTSALARERERLAARAAAASGGPVTASIDIGVSRNVRTAPGQQDREVQDAPRKSDGGARGRSSSIDMDAKGTWDRERSPAEGGAARGFEGEHGYREKEREWDRERDRERQAYYYETEHSKDRVGATSPGGAGRQSRAGDEGGAALPHQEPQSAPLSAGAGRRQPEVASRGDSITSKGSSIGGRTSLRLDLESSHNLSGDEREEPATARLLAAAAAAADAIGSLGGGKLPKSARPGDLGKAPISRGQGFNLPSPKGSQTQAGAAPPPGPTPAQSVPSGSRSSSFTSGHRLAAPEALISPRTHSQTGSSPRVTSPLARLTPDGQAATTPESATPGTPQPQDIVQPSPRRSSSGSSAGIPGDGHSKGGPTPSGEQREGSHRGGGSGLAHTDRVARLTTPAARAYAGMDPAGSWTSTVVLKDAQPVRAIAWDHLGTCLAIGSNSRTLRICAVTGLAKGDDDGSEAAAAGAEADREQGGGVSAHMLVEERDWHLGSVYCVSWNSTSRLVATGSNDQTVKVASVQRHTSNGDTELSFLVEPPGELVLEGHDGTVRDLAWSPVAESVVVSGGAGDCAIRAWDCNTSTCQAVLAGSAAAIFALRIAPDGRTVVTGGGECLIRIWDLRSGACVRQLGAHSAQVSCLELDWDSSHSPLIIGGYADGLCRVLDLGTGKELRRLLHHTADCRSLDLSPGRLWCLTAGFDGFVGIIDARNYKVASVFRAHGDKVIEAQWHPQGVGFATSSADRTVRVWTPSGPDPPTGSNNPA